MHLIDLIHGENFGINKDIKAHNVLTDDEINEKYSKGEIRIVTEQARYPLDSISAMLKSGKYDLNPEYQRRKRWTVEQQSKLIESFIINVPIPPIFIYEVSYANYEVMDGLQRLTAISEFYNDEFKLQGLEEWSELNGKRYSELPKTVKEGIDRRYLSSIVLLNETAKNRQIAESLKQMVFGRLNSGGDKLEPQETRNALFMGKFNNLCIKLSEDENFRKIWNYKLFKWDGDVLINEKELLENESYRKMEDVEMVLRFFAYRHLDLLSNFNSQEKFLDEFLKQANSYSDETINKLEYIFLETTKLIFDIFGSQALYMPKVGDKTRNTPTKTIYDPLMQVISSYIKQRELLLDKKVIINDLIYKDVDELFYDSKQTKNAIPLFDGKYNGKNNVQSRMEYFKKVINEAINR